MKRVNEQINVLFQDVGGSGPIHAVGGAAALVMSIVLKSREQKMRQMGAKYIINDINGHSVPVNVILKTRLVCTYIH